MAKAKITFDYNNSTGKRVIHIDLKSDPDSLAHEHESLHRNIVKELVGKGIISEEEADDVVIDRPEAVPPKTKDKEAVVVRPQRKGIEN